MRRRIMKGAAFSPTDLVAAALGSCILTVMGIVAKRHQLELVGTTARVVKEMATDGRRRIIRLKVAVSFARDFPGEQRRLLEQAARGCPVHHSLDPAIDAPVEFIYIHFAARNVFNGRSAAQSLDEGRLCPGLARGGVVIRSSEARGS